MSAQRNNGEFHRADPAYRRNMQVFLAVTVIVGLLFLAALHLWLAKLGTAAAVGDVSHYETWLHRLLAGLCLLLGVAAAGFSHWLHRMAAASKGERRWPPSSMRTSADVRIRYLTSADSLIGQLRLGALALGMLALLLIGWGAWLLWSI